MEKEILFSAEEVFKLAVAIFEADAKMFSDQFNAEYDRLYPKSPARSTESL